MKYEVIINEITDDGKKKEIRKAESSTFRIMLDGDIWTTVNINPNDLETTKKALGLAYKLFPDVCNNISDYYGYIATERFIAHDNERLIEYQTTLLTQQNEKLQPEPEGEAVADGIEK
jgi:hypothetical protein